MNSKFRGTLLGVLLGDCCGAVYEGEILDAGLRKILRNFIKKIDNEAKVSVALKYTDDSAMTKSVAKCLLKNNESYQKELSVNFVKEYFQSPTRGYGSGVVDLFHELKKTKFQDILTPASRQFKGQGSFGNGSAMRVAPVTLYCINKSEEFLVDLVKQTSVVTHSNVIGVNGAILQALAIRQNLSMEPKELIDFDDYIGRLLTSFEKIEKGEDEHGIPEEKHFTKQLNQVKNLLKKKYPPSDEEVVNVLGHSVNALFSVPTALFCFLRNSQNPADNPMTTTLEYAISLGGDTDTIASMACALAGSFYGDSVISENMRKHCESYGEFIQLADQLYVEASK